MNEDLNKQIITANNWKQDNKSKEGELQERNSTIADKEHRIKELKQKTQELEKFKFVLDYKIKELKREIKPRELNI